MKREWIVRRVACRRRGRGDGKGKKEGRLSGRLVLWFRTSLRVVSREENGRYKRGLCEDKKMVTSCKEMMAGSPNERPPAGRWEINKAGARRDTHQSHPTKVSPDAVPDDGELDGYRKEMLVIVDTQDGRC